MNVPLEISYRNMTKTESVDRLIRDKVAKLERVCDHISSCRVAVEKAQHKRAGNPYRIRIDMTVPPGHEVVVTRNPGEGRSHERLPTMLRKAFEAARRQLQDLTERQRGQVKTHPAQESNAVVLRLFRDDGYGFLKALDGREIYFHKNSVLHGNFERLEIGTGVRIVEEMGQEGLQASTVEIVDKPGSRLSEVEEPSLEPPAGWKP